MTRAQITGETVDHATDRLIDEIEEGNRDLIAFAKQAMKRSKKAKR